MGSLGAGGGGSYESTATSGVKLTQNLAATFGDFNVGSGASSGFKLSTATLGIIGGVAVLIAFFYFRRGH